MKTYIALLLLFCGFFSNTLQAQTITGAWKGKIGSAHTELKLIKKGDSLLGTSYYYTSRSNYVRYAVKGYFDPNNNSVIWWDEAMLEDRLSGRIFGDDGKEALLSVADFNCPGERTMRLDGESTDRDDKDKPRGTVALQKIPSSGFHDEWDFVLENYIYGANDPEIIDSIARLHGVPNEVTEEKETELASTTVKSVPKNDPSIAVKAPPIVEKKKPVPAGTAQQKFTTREKKLATVIPITGDSIELRFYDNAVVDGDSIAVFMNDKMVFEHVRLNNKPYTLKLSVNDLPEDNEMVMVAENLGTIPPNTSLMVAIVDGKRYEARLESTENSSALIRFIKQKKKNNRE